MTTIYQKYIKPKYEIETQIQEMFLEASNIDQEQAAHLVHLAERRTKGQLALDAANRVAMCSNGKSVAENLALYRSLKMLLHYSKKVHINPTSLIGIKQRADTLSGLIREANNKELDDA